MVWGLASVRWRGWGFLKRFLHLRRSRAILPSSLVFGGGVVASASLVWVVAGLVITVVVVGCGWGAVVVVVACSSARPVFTAVSSAAVIVNGAVVLVVVSLGGCVVVVVVGLVDAVVVVGVCGGAVFVVSSTDGLSACSLEPVSKYLAVVAP